MITLSYLDPRNICRQDELDAMISRYRGLTDVIANGEVRYADSLGWLDVDEWAGEDTIASIEETAANIRQNADAFVIIGVGGSNNAARSVIEALQSEGSPEIIYMGNTLSPHALSKSLNRLKGKSVYVNCIAKNFETLEPGISFRILRDFLQKQYGQNYGNRILATGTQGSHLESLCKTHGWQFFDFPPNIGGRFTALSNVGLLPMAVAGIDIRKLVKGANKLRAELLTAKPEENTALRYACLRNLLYQKGYKLEMLSAFEPQLRWFFKWWIQLFAESEGKDGKGLFPVASECSEELHSVGQYIQDGEPLLFETFLDAAEANASLKPLPDDVDDHFSYLNGKDLWDINKAAFKATRSAHSKKLPCLTLEISHIDEENFGALFYFFQCTCYLSGTILGINPFDQPGVEAYKNLMFSALEK